MTITINGTNGLIQAYDYQVLTTGFTYTFAAGTQVLVINPAGTLATGTITMPASPSDGMTITFSSTKIITALTVNANTGQTINNAVTTLSAGQSVSYIYRLSSTAWFPFTSTVATATTYSGVNSTRFTTTGSGQTFTIPAGVTQVKATIVAGGGAGGAGTGTNANGAGGGAGGSAIKWLTGLTPGNTLTVTVGAAGGSSSIASGTQTITTVSATAGSGASGSSPGAGGVGSSGDLNIGGGGGSGGAGAFGTTVGMSGGAGGSSILGGGGQGGTTFGGAGGAGRVYGGGGGGGGGGPCGAGPAGAGAQGVVIFEY